MYGYITYIHIPRDRRERKQESKKKRVRDRERERGKYSREKQGKTLPMLPTPLFLNLVTPLRPATLCLPDPAQCNSLSTRVLSKVSLAFLFCLHTPHFHHSSQCFSMFLKFLNFLNFSQRALLRKIRNVALAAGRSTVCIFLNSFFLNSFSQSLLGQPLFSQYLRLSQSLNFLNFSELFLTALVEE